MCQRVKMYVAVVLMAVLFLLPLFLAVESSRNPSDAWYELPWAELMVMMVAVTIAAPIFVWIILRLIYWVYPDLAELVKGRNNPIEREKFLSWCVIMGIDPPRPEDLARMRVIAVTGPWMEKMPEEVYLTIEERHGEPVHYRRADVIGRIERRCYSTAGYCWVGGGDVRRELFALAEFACGGTRQAVEWFNLYNSAIYETPIDFLNRGGDPQAVEELLVTMAARKSSPQHE